eukprot:5142435-Alexandrium_andersonii.AAC.1
MQTSGGLWRSPERRRVLESSRESRELWRAPENSGMPRRAPESCGNFWLQRVQESFGELRSA